MYKPREIRWTEEFDYGTVDINYNWSQLEKQNKEAKEAGVLKGRYIKEPYADGFAVYEIIRENKKTVRIKACTGIGDDWVIPMWGEEATVSKEYVLNSIKRDEFFEEFRNKNKN